MTADDEARPPRKNAPEIRASAMLTYEAEEERKRAVGIFTVVVDDALAARPAHPEVRALVRRMAAALKALRDGSSVEAFVLQQE